MTAISESSESPFWSCPGFGGLVNLMYVPSEVELLLVLESLFLYRAGLGGRGCGGVESDEVAKEECLETLKEDMAGNEDVVFG